MFRYSVFINVIDYGFTVRKRLIFKFSIGVLVWGIGLSIINVFPSVAILYIGATLVGLGQSIEGLTRSVAIQIKTPNHLMGKVFSISSTSNYAADTLSLGLISLIIPLLSLSNIFISGGAIISMLSLSGLKFLRSLCKHNRILINAIKVGIEMKYKISLAYNLAIIIGSLIILCILISRGYDIYVILIQF